MKQNFCLRECIAILKIALLKTFIVLLLSNVASAQTPSAGIIKGKVTDVRKINVDAGDAEIEKFPLIIADYAGCCSLIPTLTPPWLFSSES